MITFTEKAASVVLNIMKEQDVSDNTCVRVGVKGGGCSGLTYTVDFDGKKGKFDLEFESHGLNILVDKKSYLYLVGTILNYSGGLNGKGFVFENPNASRTCGCGESFAV